MNPWFWIAIALLLIITHVVVFVIGLACGGELGEREGYRQGLHDATKPGAKLFSISGDKRC